MGKKALLLVVIFAGLLAGCSPGEAGPSDKTSREPLLLWSYYEVDGQRKALDKLVSDFNSSQSRYTAEWKYVPMTEFSKRLAIGFTGKDLPDMVLIDNPDMKNYVDLGLFEDITEDLQQWADKRDYYPEVWKSVEYRGRIYGYPFSCNNLALFYNKDMLAESGLTPPETWGDFSSAARKLTKNNTYGFAMSAIEGEQSAFQMVSWILSSGEKVDEIGGEKTERAFDLIRGLVESGAMDANCVNWSQTDLARKFAAGEVAMMENGPWVLSILKEAGVPYGITSFPGEASGRTVMGGENLGVVKGKNTEGAMAFLKFYSQDTIMMETALQSNTFPPRIALTEKNMGQDPDYRVFAAQMSACVSRVGFTNWKAVSSSASRLTYQVIMNEKSPEEAAAELSESMKEN